MLSLGSISHGTLLSEDLASAIASTLRDLDHDDSALLRDLDTIATTPDDAEGDWEGWDSEVIESGIDALQEYAPPFCYVGMHEGDGSDFGVWPMLDAIQDAIAEGELIQINDPSDIDDLSIADCSADYAVYVNDHGNITLYRLKVQGVSIWDCV